MKKLKIINKSNFKTNKILEEMKLSVILYNNVIIKNDSYNRLKEICINSKRDEKIRILFKIINYIWLLQDKKLFNKIKKMYNKCEDDEYSFDEYLLEGVSIDYSLSLSIYY